MCQTGHVSTELRYDDRLLHLLDPPRLDQGGDQARSRLLVRVLYLLYEVPVSTPISPYVPDHMGVHVVTGEERKCHPQGRLTSGTDP